MAGLAAQRAEAEAKRAARAAAAAERRQAVAAARAAKATPPAPATLAAGLGDDDDDDDWDAPVQPHGAAADGSGKQLEPQEAAPASLRRGHRRKVHLSLAQACIC